MDLAHLGVVGILIDMGYNLVRLGLVSRVGDGRANDQSNST